MNTFYIFIILTLLLLLLINITIIKELFSKKLKKINNKKKFEDGTFRRYNNCLYNCNSKYYCDYLTCKNTCENQFFL
jgi:NADH:ubiquinone oxidoreductase subunit 3 (subunit A)